MRLSPDYSCLCANLICYNFPVTGFKSGEGYENKQPQHGCIYYSILRTKEESLKISDFEEMQAVVKQFVSTALAAISWISCCAC